MSLRISIQDAADFLLPSAAAIPEDKLAVDLADGGVLQTALPDPAESCSLRHSAPDQDSRS